MLNLTIKPIWIIVDNLIQNEVGHTDYGKYNALFSLCALFTVLYDFGIGHFSAQNIAKDNTLFKKLFPSLFFVRLLALIFFPFFITFCGYLLGYRDFELWWLFLLSVSANLFQFSIFFRAKFQAFHYFKTDAFASVFQKLLLIIFVAFLFEYGINIQNFLIAEVITHFIVFVILYALVIQFFGWVRLTFNITDIKKIVIGALPFALMTLLYSLSAKVDVVMLERLLNNSNEAGLYYAAVRLFDAGMMYPWAIMPMFFAKFATYHSEIKKTQDLLRIGTIIMFVPILVLGTIFIIEPEPLFILFNNSSREELEIMKSVLVILGIAFIIHGISVVMGTYLNASGMVNKVNIWVFYSLVVNIIINFFFIKEFGAIATAWSTSISTFVLMIGYIYLIRKTNVSFDFKLIIRLSIMAFVLFGSSYAFKIMAFSWYINWIFVVCLAGFLTFVFGLWKKELYHLEE